MGRIRSVFCAFIAGLGMAVAPLRAAPLDDKVPQESIIYIGWAGADALGPEYAKSNLKSILDASSVQKWVSTEIPLLLEKAGGRNPEIPQVIEKLKTSLGIAWRHPCAFYLCPITMTNPRTPDFRLGLICDAGTDAPAIMAIIKDALAKDPPPPDMPLHVTQEGTFVLMEIGKPETLADLSKGGGLKTFPSYVKTMAQVKQEGQAIGLYLDARKLFAMVEDLVQKNAPLEARDKVTLLMESLGVKGMTQIAMLSGFDGKGWSEHAFVGMNGRRIGILSLFDSPPVSDVMLAAVPKDAAAFGTFRLDLQKIFNEARTIIGNVEPRAVVELEKALVQGGKELNVDIEKDLIGALGDEWLIYRAPSDAGMSFAMINKLRDGATFAKSLDTLEKLFNEKSGSPIHVEKVKAGAVDVSAVMFLQYSVAWTVQDGYLYVSSLAGIAPAMAQVEKKLPSIATSDLYKGAIARMPAGVKPTSINYSHPARLYPEIRTMVLGVLPLLRSQGITIPMDILPDPTQVSEFMTPGAGITWSDADGLHGINNAAFPGADMLGGQQIGAGTVAGAAAVTAVALPFLGRTRAMPNRSVDAANLRGIGQSCNVFAADNADKFPEHLARLIERGDISPRSLVTKRSGTPPLVMTPEMIALAKDNFEKFCQEVDKHCDFVYLGAGLKTTVDAGIVLAYEKPGPWTPDGITVAFQDAHVEFMPGFALANVFQATNILLAKKNLPQVDVDAIVKQFGGPVAAPMRSQPPRPVPVRQPELP